MIKPWKKLSSTPIGNFRIFTIRSDRKISPRTGSEHDFFIIESVNWVNVIATTADNQLVMVEQYRHGSETVELEVPGGMMDPSDAGPVETGLRELREETGYIGSSARIIGQIYSNPAILNNITYTLLVENCELRHEAAPDGAEDLRTRLVPMDEIPELIRAGRIGHALVVVALYHHQLSQSGQKHRADSR